MIVNKVGGKLQVDDVLNVRAEPAASAEKIGSLGLGEIVEVYDTARDGAWSKIAFREAAGWVSSAYLDPLATGFASNGMVLGLSCSGNEPFWGLDFRDGLNATFQREAQTSDAPLKNVAPSQNFWRAAIGFQVLDYQGLLTKGACSDGASDRPYGWTVHLIDTESDGLVLSGCCSIATQ
ncbi:MAG: SH3 domain-containing protein [Pseudomonadota bacterium]